LGIKLIPRAAEYLYSARANTGEQALSSAFDFEYLPPESFFAAIVEALSSHGWIVIPDFLQANSYTQLFSRALSLRGGYSQAAIGRGGDEHENTFVRTDSIVWLDSSDAVDRSWLNIMEQLRQAINRALFLGLFEYESHYACFEPGSYYKRHTDAFRGEGNRIVSVVLYLNPDWQPQDGGEFVIYPEANLDGESFLPVAGSLAVFLSEKFPHEVLRATRTRYSIAGWFRLNGTYGDKLDPPA